MLRPWRTSGNSLKEISARNLFLRIMDICLYKLDLLCLIFGLMSKIFIFSLHLKMSVDLRERGLNDLKALHMLFSR